MAASRAPTGAVTIGSERFFFTARLGASGAPNARTLDLGVFTPLCLFCDDQPREVYGAPLFTVTLEAIPGFRAPIDEHSAFLFGALVMASFTETQLHLGAGATTGLEVVF
jgi:hypothetical protein